MKTEKSIFRKLMLFLVFCIGITSFSVIHKPTENIPVKKYANVVVKKVIVPLHIIQTIPQLEVIVIGKKQIHNEIKQDSQNIANFEDCVEPLISPVPTITVDNLDVSSIICPTFPV